MPSIRDNFIIALLSYPNIFLMTKFDIANIIRPNTGLYIDKQIPFHRKKSLLGRNSRERDAQ